MEKTTPLCVSQYENIFATRIPHSFRDELHRSPDNTKHIVVIHRDNFFLIDIFNDQGRPLSKDQIQYNIDEILSDKSRGVGVGLFTTEERTTWSSLRNKLLQNNQNQQSLGKIEDALFVVCLEDSTPNTPQEMSQLMLHSDGTNRWFDKSLQLIVCKNGKSGINMEHQGVDGYLIILFKISMILTTVLIVLFKSYNYSFHNRYSSR